MCVCHTGVVGFLKHGSSFCGHELLQVLVSQGTTPFHPPVETVSRFYRSYAKDTDGEEVVEWVFGWDPETGKDEVLDSTANHALLDKLKCLRNIPEDVSRVVVIGFGLRDPHHFNKKWNGYPMLTHGGVIEVGVDPDTRLEELVFVDSAVALSYILPCVSFDCCISLPPKRISLIILDNDRSGFWTTEFRLLLDWITDPNGLLLRRDRGIERRIGRVDEVHVSSGEAGFLLRTSFVLELFESPSQSRPFATIEFVVHFQALDRHRQARFEGAFENFLLSSPA